MAAVMLVLPLRLRSKSWEWKFPANWMMQDPEPKPRLRFKACEWKIPLRNWMMKCLKQYCACAGFFQKSQYKKAETQAQLSLISELQQCTHRPALRIQPHRLDLSQLIDPIPSSIRTLKAYWSPEAFKRN